MTAKNRTLDSITRQINKHGSFETYVAQLSLSTVKNYKKLLFDYIDKSIDCTNKRKTLKQMVFSKSQNDLNQLEKDKKELNQMLKKFEEEFVLNGFMCKENFELMGLLIYSFVPLNQIDEVNSKTASCIKHSEGIILKFSIHDGCEKKYLLKNYIEVFKYVFEKSLHIKTQINSKNAHYYFNRVQQDYEESNEKIICKGGVTKLRDLFKKIYLTEII